MDNFTIMIERIATRKKDGFAGERVCILPVDIKHALQKNTLCKNLYLTDIGFYPKALYHNRERQHGCNQFILIYCIHGEGWFSIHRKTYKLKANHFFILPENVAHKYGSDPGNPWTIYWVHFTGEMAADYSHYLMGKRSLTPKIVVPSNERNVLFEEIVHYASMINNNDAVIYANNCLYNYLASFKNEIFSRSDSGRKQTSTIDACIEMMKQNLDKNLNLYEISQMMKLSISHLSALFKEKVHDSPYNYYIFLKVQRACYLLWNTQMNIKTIAVQLGYDDPYHFSRIFKNMMGVSPKHFRQRDSQ
ncbi:MAG: AraC family transcriptional regulator [Chitinophagaceae bacterium]|jgi:AraC-like DNA-binding protein|nr:MAG: AraC family transcriptional regulator [Chitinophagaceae bacterium]